MISIRRILCPVDFSDASKHALEYAVVLARWYEAELTVMHAAGVPLGVPVAVQAGPVVPEPPGLSAARRADLRNTLNRFAEPFVEAQDPATIHLRVTDGLALDEIPDLAERLPADLIVMGTHGRKGLQRLVLGSVAERLLRVAPCPVMIVPPRSAGVTPPAFKRVLCAVDFSTSSQRAVDYALSLAEESDAGLLLLHVVPPLPESMALEQPMVRVLPPREEQLAEARDQLAAMVPAAARDYCTVTEVVATGKPGEEILRIAGENEIDLVVMGVRRRGPTDLMFFGSTTQHVVRQATCLVMTVRDQ